MVKVEGAKNFGIGLGLIVEDALFAVRLDFTIFQVEIECEGSIFLHDDQVTVIDLSCPLTEQHAAGGNAVLLISGHHRSSSEGALYHVAAKPALYSGDQSQGKGHSDWAETSRIYCDPQM